MTAPALTPAEQTEVTRFGAHDEEILRDIAEHFDDTVPCHFDEAAAVWLIAMRCCGRSALYCDGCRERRREWVQINAARGFIRCVGCGHILAKGSRYADVIREMQL